MLYTLNGTLVVKRDEVQITDKFKKREFVVELDDKYPQLITLFLANDKCEWLDQVNAGDILEVKFALKGKRWEKEGQVKYFNSLEAIGIEVESVEETPAQPALVSEPQSDENNDLPF